MPRDQLAALFQAARKKAGYRNCYHIYQKTGISTATLYAIERGDSSPTVATLERIFNAIGWDVVITFRPRKHGYKRRKKSV